jgi:ribosomal protein S8
MNLSINNLISILQSNKLKKSSKIVILYSKKRILFLQKLVAKGFIIGFQLDNKSKNLSISVILKRGTNEKNPIKELSFVSKLSNKRQYCKKDLKTESNNNLSEIINNSFVNGTKNTQKLDQCFLILR